MSVSGQTQKTKSQFQEFPGLFSRGQAGGFLGQVQQRLGGGAGSPFDQPLQQALTDPQFGAQSPAQQALVNQLVSGSSARFNRLGIRGGRAAESQIAASAAPALIGLRQQGIQNLLGARGQDISRLLGLRGQDLQSLLGLLGFAQPTLAQTGQTTTGVGAAGKLF